MSLKDINIGHSIRERVDASSMSYSEFARRINRSRTAIYSLFNCKSIDTELLLRISEVLDYDFFCEIYGLSNIEEHNNSSITIPFKDGMFDLSDIPEEIKRILKRQLNDVP